MQRVHDGLRVDTRLQPRKKEFVTRLPVVSKRPEVRSRPYGVRHLEREIGAANRDGGLLFSLRESTRCERKNDSHRRKRASRNVTEHPSFRVRESAADKVARSADRNNMLLPFSAEPSVLCIMIDPRVRARPMSLDEFLRFETDHPERHEFVGGDVYTMPGGTLRHSTIVQNVSFRLMQRAQGSPCRVHTHDVKVQVGDDRIYYPDVLVLCTALPGDTLIVHEPRLIVEVTSPATVRIDRGEKLDSYRRLRSLLAYLVVDQRRRRVDRHWRDRGGMWQREEYLVEGTVSVPCLDTSLTLDEIYEGVDLPRVSEPDLVEYGV